MMEGWLQPVGGFPEIFHVILMSIFVFVLVYDFWTRAYIRLID
jgi:hypothetical protein